QAQAARVEHRDVRRRRFQVVFSWSVDPALEASTTNITMLDASRSGSTDHENTTWMPTPCSAVSAASQLFAFLTFVVRSSSGLIAGMPAFSIAASSMHDA